MSDDLQRVLNGLMCGENQTRKAAEAYFEQQLLQNPLGTTQDLLSVLSNANSPAHLRSFAGVLMRRAIEKSTFGPDLDAQLRAALISIWKSERDPTLLKRLAHAMAQSAMKKDSPWSDLLIQVVEFASVPGTDAVVVIPALVLIEVLTQYCPSMILANLQGLGPFLGALLVDNNPPVQAACTRATCACIVSLTDDNARNAFKPALQQIINILGQILSRGDESEATAVMEYLVYIAQDQPIFFKESLDNVVAAMLTVARASDLDFSTRSIALELMVTLSETAPALARRCPGLVEGLVPLAMSIILEVDEAEDSWARGKYMSEPEEDENFFVGEEALERAAAGMGGRVLVPTTFCLAQQYMASSEWAARRAAISGLCRLAEGCAKSFKSYLPNALKFLESALVDPSPRVRYQALETIGRFANLFPQSVPEMIGLFIPTMITLIQDPATCERVRGHALGALIDLTDPESCAVNVLEGHIEPLLRALSGCLQVASIEVQPLCLDLLGRVAQVSNESFRPYYSAFMPGVKTILRSATTPESVKLGGKAMQCSAAISEAVGAEVFSADAMEVMWLILNAMPNGLPSTCGHDILFEHILPACARIAKTLGPQFEQFLPTIMGPLLAGASQEVECNIVDAGVDDDDDDDDAEGDGVDEETGMTSHVFDFGAGCKKRVYLNTHAVLQKKAAADMLYEFATSLRGNLYHYLAPCFQAVIPMLANKHSSEVRSSASLALAKLFEALVDAFHKNLVTEDDVISALSESLTHLLRCLEGEINTTARACAAEALRDVLQACYLSGSEAADGSHDDPLCRPDIEICSKIIQELLARCADCLLRHRDHEQAFFANEGLEAEDKGVLTEDLEEEEELLRNLTDAMGQVLKLHKEALMPIFDQTVAPMYSSFLAADQPTSLQIVAVCLIDDVIEFGGASGLKYIPTMVPVFLRNLQSEHPVLRQSSAYGIAQAAKAAPEFFSQFLNVAVPALLALVNAANARDEENEGTTENAIYSLGILSSLAQYRALGFDGQGLMQTTSTWLRGLPLRADEQEAKCTLSHLCDSIERGDGYTFGGETFSNLAEILRILAEVLLEGNSSDNEGFTYAHPSTLQRMALIVRAVALGTAGIPAHVTQTAFGQLSVKHQGFLQGVLTPNP